MSETSKPDPAERFAATAIDNIMVGKIAEWYTSVDVKWHL